MTQTTRPRKSTNVRLHQLRSAGLRLLSPHAPALAARYAEYLFTHASRHQRPDWEREILKAAERSWLGGTPVWTWGGDRDVPAVILVHGWEGRGSQLGALVDPLLAAGHRVVTFDAPGHGDSRRRRASVVDHARAVAKVARSVGAVHAVVAHSVGGTATLLATRFGLKAERYVLVSPPKGPDGYVNGFTRAFALDANIRDAMIDRLEDRFQFPFEELDARTDASRTKAPILVVHDRNDKVVPLRDGEAIVRASQQGTLFTTDGLGHRRILRDPRVAKEIVSFVGEHARTFGETLEGELFNRWSRTG